MSDAGPEQWFWDLKRGRAVRGSERGPDRDTLGPYATREAAEAWRETRDAREAVWTDQDEAWEGEGDGPGDGDGPAGM